MTRIALVTGANQGLGYALVEELAARMDPADLVLLTGRDPDRVKAAADRVRGRARVEGRVLDVADTSAIIALAAELGRTDIVVSNAVAPLVPDRPQTEQADEFVAVSNTATHAVLRSFAPTLAPGGRLLVVASSLGTLGHLEPRLHPLFDDVPLESVETAVADWLGAVHDGTAQEKGWPKWVNVPSKVAQVAAVRAVAVSRRADDLAAGRLIAAVCPGLVDTRASRPWFADFSQARSPRQAAAPIVDLALNPLDPSTYGELVRFGKVLPWHDGEPPRRQDELVS
ncbi:SDR family NAD(P)-dependent oxidoreductase [Actinophytocola oryzae]|uniref:Short subunit dehydrogenase n=1 Tax=Actinophytocola oryzae TaxID=502181 RepID=A0A4R7VEZ5_9PSEU|nr:SDR family NAD(P)-dependent oxidoreductase [Actinophytocola oryzae]TDV47782.1 short subunit dehydrogenase [Actinophytocola oryzae]